MLKNFKNKNKIIENSCLIASGIGGVLGFLYKQALYVAIPMVSIAIYMSRVEREKYENFCVTIQNELNNLEGRFNSNIDYFEDSLQSLPNNMISYYTQRLAPMINQLQSQQEMNEETISILQKDFRENWQFISDLGKRLDEIDEDFKERSEINDIKKNSGSFIEYL